MNFTSYSLQNIEILSIYLSTIYVNLKGSQKVRGLEAFPPKEVRSPG